jgi:PAS domain S-box-containing protein
VVEDNPITRKMVRVTLEAAGFVVLEAPDGKTALELAARERPILVLQDLLLPDTDGFDLVVQLRTLPAMRDIPILAFTGFLSRVEESRLSAVGFTDMLLKPVEPSRLVHVVRSHLAPTAGSADKRPGARTPLRILLVDDSPTQLLVQQAVLTKAGYDVSVAADGIEALVAARKRKPDIIVSDVLMPKMDGFRLTAAVRADQALTLVPVVLVSSQYVSPEDRDLALSLGAQNFVLRTPAFDDLLQAVGMAAAAPVATKPVADAEALNAAYFQRVLVQLDRQTTINDGLMQRASLQASALAILGAITEAVGRGSNVEVRLQEVLAQCIDAAGLSRGAVYLRDRGGPWRCGAHVGYGSTPTAELATFFGHVPLLNGIVEQDHPVVITLGKGDSAGRHQDFLARAGASTALVAPLQSPDGVTGALLLVSASRTLEGEDWRGFAQAVASQLGQGIALSRAFAQLADSEQRYRTLFEGSQVGMYRSAPDGSGLVANPALLKMLGYDSNEQFQSSYRPERHVDAETLQAMNTALARDGAFSGLELQFRRLDGSAFWASLDSRAVWGAAGQLAFMEGSIIDISGRRAAELRNRWLTAAVEQNPAAVFMTDLHGTIEYVNTTFAQSTGYTAAEALGQSPRLLKSGLTPPRVYHDLWRTILAGRTWRGEVQNRRKNGELYWDAVMISPVRDASGVVTHFLAVQRDVTEQKKSDEAFRDSEQRYRTLFEGNPHPMWVVDAETYRFLAVNTATVQHYGYSREEFLTMSALDIRPEADVRRFKASMRRGGRGVRMTAGWRHRKKDGTLIDVEISTHDVVFGGRPAMLALVTDVSERRLSEAALRAREAELSSIYNTVADMVFSIAVGGEGVYSFSSVNPAFLSSRGLGADQVVGKRVDAVIPEPSLTASLEKYGEAIREKRIVRWVETTKYPAGVRTGEISVAPVFDAAGVCTHLVGSVHDVTELKRAEEQATQAQKMDAVGRLAGGVAHDFNNLLTVILGNIELMELERPAAHSGGESLREVKQAAERAVSLTRQLLAFSRRQIVEPTTFMLNDIVADLLKMLQRLIGEDIEIVTRLAPDAGAVRADRGQIEQVLINLAVNARDAMPGGGRLTIETQTGILDEGYAQSRGDVAPGDYAVLVVTDTGTGMSDDVKVRVFEPFFTTKEQGKGTGLGLATSYGIVKQSGGHFTVYSELGLGTTMKVYLPSVVSRISYEIPAQMAPLPRGSETILLVEDEVAVRDLAAKVLALQGYRVLSAGDGEEALRIAAAEPDISLLLTDVVMPRMGGRELAERIVVIRPDLKILFATGYTDDAILQHKLSEHGVRVIQKPYTRDSLSRKVRQVLDERGP